MISQSQEWNHAGIAHFEAGQWEAAQQAFGKALESDPQNAEIWSNLGAVFHRLGRISEARQALETALLQDWRPETSEDLAYLSEAALDWSYVEAHCVEHLRRVPLASAELTRTFLKAHTRRSEFAPLLEKMNLAPDQIFDWITQYAQAETYRSSLEGALIRALMQGPAGKSLRALNPWLRPKCKQFPGHLVMLSDLSITTCCDDPMGKNRLDTLANKNLGEIWAGSARDAVLGDLWDLEACKGCIGSGRASLTTSPEEYRAWQTEVDADLECLTVEVMGKCNYACDKCAANDVMNERDTKPDLDKLFLNIQESLPTLKRLRLFNWGEPLLHPDLGDFCRKVKEINPAIVLLISTNGMLLGERKAQEMINAGVDQILVSVHGGAGTENLLKYARQGADYNKVMSNIDRLIQMRDAQGKIFPKISLRSLLFVWNDNPENMEMLRRDARAIGLGAAWGNPDVDNYHWTYDTHNDANTSKIYRPGSSAVAELVDSGEFFAPEQWGKVRWSERKANPNMGKDAVASAEPKRNINPPQTAPKSRLNLQTLIEAAQSNEAWNAVLADLPLIPTPRAQTDAQELAQDYLRFHPYWKQISTWTLAWAWLRLTGTAPTHGKWTGSDEESLCRLWSAPRNVHGNESLAWFPNSDQLTDTSLTHALMLNQPDWGPTWKWVEIEAIGGPFWLGVQQCAF